MTSLKRDTPAGRAALARRRQRAAAVVDHNARFGLEEGGVGTSEDSNQSPPASDRDLHQDHRSRETQHNQQQQQRTLVPPRSSQQRDPPPQQNKQQEPRGISKDPPQRIPAEAAVPTSYSTSRLPSSDELLERSSQVAKAAASVLASARKTKNPQRNYEYTSDSKSSEMEHYAPTPHDMAHSHGSASFQTPRPIGQSADATIIENSQSAHLQNSAYSRSPARASFHTNMENTIEREDQRIHHQNEIGPETQNSVQPTEYDITNEEREPVISEQDSHEILDAACLKNGARIMVRSVAASGMVTISPQDNGESWAAAVGGAGLGAPDEVFQVFISDGNLRYLLEKGNAPLRWGDNVALVNIGHNKNNDDIKTLGVRKRASGHYGIAPTTDRICWSRPNSGGQVDTWTLLRGDSGPRQGVRVGLSAPQKAKALADQRTARGGVTQVVRSGESVLLRHDLTGGLLSVKMDDASLQLVSDSYSSNRGDAFREGLSTSNDLMGQLQMHSLYVPRDQDFFFFVLASTPPCPRWIQGGESCSGFSKSLNPRGHRMYLRQSYLTESDRNVVNHKIHEKLFENKWPPLISFEEPGPAAENMALAEQESVIIDEVLGVCLGLEGRWIVSKENGYNPSDCSKTQNIQFCLRDGSQSHFDASIRNLAEKVLPLGASYLHVSAFVSSHLPGYEHGSVMQAFCEALSSMLVEYGTFVATLEEQFRKSQTSTSTLTMRALYACLVPSLHTMAILEKATVAVRNKIGGCLLNALSSLKSWGCEGDLVANTVLGILLEKSSVPYMRMLTSWLQDGLLQDPYGEFMIEIDEKSPGSSWQNSRATESFVLKQDHVFTELFSSDVLLQKVQVTGKYWRAVKACEVVLRKKTTAWEDVDVQHGTQPTRQHCINFGSVASFIQTSYDAASLALVNLLMNEFNLMQSLRLMKQYFLLDHGDFLGHFLDSAEEELKKELGDISIGRIQHWVRTSVQLTELHGNRGDTTATPSKSSTLSPLALRCRFHPTSLTNHIETISMRGDSESDHARDHSVLDTPQDSYGASNKVLTGVETFVLDFPVVPFPISMVLSNNAISKYQLLFRLLFFAKHVERRLLGIWRDHQAMKELNSVRGLFGPTFLLRQRMLHFAQNLIYYFMFEVIEPNWLQMEQVITDPATASRRTVDNIVEVHDNFLQRTLEACLLTNRELVGTLTKLMTTCLMFADQMKLFTEATRIHDESSHIAAERRKAIQRSLNDRGGGGAKVPVDKSAVRDAIHSFKLDRQTRLKKQKRRVGRELSSESYRRMVGRFDEVFRAYLSEFIIQVNGDNLGSAGTVYQEEQRQNLCTRLDYNGFLSSTMLRPASG